MSDSSSLPPLGQRSIPTSGDSTSHFDAPPSPAEQRFGDILNQLAANQHQRRALRQQRQELLEELGREHPQTDHEQGLLIEDVEGSIVWINRALLELLGLSEDVTSFLEKAQVDRHTLLASTFEDPGSILKPTGDILAGRQSPKPEICRLTDGTNVERSSQPICIGDEVVGRLWHYENLEPDKPSVRDDENVRNIIVETALDSIITIDPKGSVVDWNAVAEETFGYSRSEARGRCLGDLILPQEYRKAHCEGLARHLRTGETRIQGRRIQLSALRRDGGTFPCEVTVRRIPNSDPPLFIGFLRDISERQQAEQALKAARARAEEANQAKSLFLAALSHEIRTPLNAILGMTEVTLDTTLSEDQRESLETVHASASMLLALIGDLLDFSKIEAGQILLEEQPFSLQELIHNTLAILKTRAESKRLELRADLGPKLPQALTGDENRLRQILLNLTVNAIKFTDTGEVTISVRSLPGPNPEVARIVFEVTDTGIGIAPEHIERIFDRFFQISHRQSATHSGTGLGLAITASLVATMGGEIELDSEVGRGSRFRVTLDLPLAEALPERDPTETLWLLGGDKSRTFRLLLAEDHPANRRVIMKILESTNCEVETATNGAEAVDRAAAFAYDLILIDLEMPIMDGLEASRRIRLDEIRQNRPAVPLIALTAHALSELQERCRLQGVDDYLVKPVHRKHLLKTIDRWLKTSVKRRAAAVPPASTRAIQTASDPSEKVPDGDDFRIEIAPDLADLLPEYLDDLEADLEKMESLIAERDFRALAHIGHNLKGSGALYGMNRVSQLGDQLEVAAQQAAMDRLATAFQQISTYVTKARQHLS